MSQMLRVLGIIMFFASPASAASAASLLGTWAAEPDSKGQVGHIDITPCGAALCGTIVRIFDKAGQPATTPNLGRRILRDVTQTGPNTYDGGKVYVPILGAEFNVDITLTGNSLKLSACNALSVCRSQRWRRVP